MKDGKKSGRLHDDRTNTENERLARDIGSEKWIKAKRQTFAQEIEDHKKNEKQKFIRDTLFSAEMSLSIILVCIGAATFITRLFASETMDSIDLAYYQAIGLTCFGLLLLIGISRIWRKRIERNMKADK